MRALQWCLAVAAALGAASQGNATEAPRRLPFSAPVTVAVDGTASVGTVEGVQGELAAIVARELKALPYVPAAGAVPSTVLVDGEAVLVPSGDAFDVVLEDIRTQPRLLAWRPAGFPRELLGNQESGTVVLVLQVDADGRVAGSDVAVGRSAGLVAAAREAVRHWRFEPSALAHAVGAPFWFHGNWERAEIPDIACPVQVQLAHLAGDDGCLRISETTGDVFGRGCVAAASGCSRPSRGEARGFTPRLVRPPAPPSAGGRHAVAR